MSRKVVIRHVVRLGAVWVLAAIAPTRPAGAQDLPRGFVRLADVDASIAREIRYAGSHNFVGRPVAGYEAAECILTRRAAEALRAVQARLRSAKLSLKVYDCYRPERAVRDFVRWAEDLGDEATKAEFYPGLDKRELFRRGFLSARSAHSRGSAVDLTLVALNPVPTPQAVWRPGEPLRPCTLPLGQRYADTSLDMGTGFDCFHERSAIASRAVSPEAQRNRRLLLSEMTRAGFRGSRSEWWHYELDDEPFPGRSFDFPVTARPSD